jgi:D-lyxose ketol-isomerase
MNEVERVEKPWGYELIWARSSSDDGYVGKILFINAGHRLSLQYHEKKEETILVKSGVLYLETFGEAKDLLRKDSKDLRRLIKLNPGETFHIKPLVTHRFIANESNVELIEVSTNYLEDVIRIEDDYNRGE